MLVRSEGKSYVLLVNMNTHNQPWLSQNTEIGTVWNLRSDVLCILQKLGVLQLAPAPAFQDLKNRRPRLFGIGGPSQV